MTHRKLRLGAIALAGFIALAGVLAACGSGTQQTARQAVAASATLYATSRLSYEVYANLPRCTTPPAVKPCSDPAKVVSIGGDLLAARDAIDLARQVVNRLPPDTPAASLTGADKLAVDQAAQAAGTAQTAVGAVK